MRQTLWYRGGEGSGVPGTTAACQDEVPSAAECSQGTLAGDSHGRGPGLQPQEARCDALLRQQSGSSYTSAASHASDLSAPGDPLPSPPTEASEEEGDTGPHGWKHVPFTEAEALATEAGLRTPDAAHYSRIPPCHLPLRPSRPADSLLDVGHRSGRLGPRACQAGPFRAVNPLALHIPFPHRGGDGGGGGSHPVRAASMGSLPAPHRRRASVEAPARRGSWTQAPARRGSWTQGLAPPCAWVPCAVPEGAPDLERFLQSSTPVLPFHDDAELAAASLADVWMVYEESSAFGLATPRLGAPVGPCSAAYLPFLSALHTFAPEDAPPHGRPGAAMADPGAADSWAARAAPSFSWTAEGHMTERVPLWEQVRKLRVREESAVPRAAARRPAPARRGGRASLVRGAVLSTPYPLSRGGPLSWDIQLEELWEGAERLASGAEARARGGGGADTRGKDGADAPRASGRFPACPDYHFFVSRRGAAHAH
ncbi:hypothetical protein APUTEX25_002966 [Auxenochlorella protothecoides]|uniref:Uncharacterized protein n=1 Tax=Auxenochlorella protothecoides TaxID=3075 RepID=A0A3M7L2R1_AUXPR|nr:hypothetical protein APUTEX25_002966 [Auxenochlorella protothecoides]|eukprot:RMZ56877.1 hypothetical protein APUTEX25_002966 [Auxenochlorella protothecoides]